MVFIIIWKAEMVESDSELLFHQYMDIQCACNVISEVDSLTGRLVFFQNEQGSRVQVLQRLEGEYKAVMNLFGKLCHDRRWGTFKVLRMQYEHVRAFPSMHCDIHPEKADEGPDFLLQTLISIFQSSQQIKTKSHPDIMHAEAA